MSYDTINTPGESIESYQDERRPGMGWLLPLLLLVLAGGLLLYFMKGCNNAAIPGTVLVQDTLSSVAAIADSPKVSARKRLSIRLSDSTEITAYKNGIENLLVLYITSKNPADSINKNRWFDFDDLNFKTGSAEITDSSMHQVQNIAAILHTYPNVKIKIGGYTDKTGDEVANMKLSQARADAVFAALQKAGVVTEQLTGAEGYGSAFAKAAVNGPDSLKQKDRRISVNVKAK